MNGKRKRFHRIQWLLASCLSFVLFFLLLLYLPPQSSVSFKNISFPNLILFFPLLFASLFSIVTFISKNKQHGLLLGGFAVTYLLFRLNHLTNLFFLILLLALFFVLELLVSSRGSSKE